MWGRDFSYFSKKNFFFFFFFCEIRIKCFSIIINPPTFSGALCLIIKNLVSSLYFTFMLTLHFDILTWSYMGSLVEIVWLKWSGPETSFGHTLTSMDHSYSQDIELYVFVLL